MPGCVPADARDNGERSAGADRTDEAIDAHAGLLQISTAVVCSWYSRLPVVELVGPQRAIRADVASSSARRLDVWTSGLAP